MRFTHSNLSRGHNPSIRPHNLHLRLRHLIHILPQMLHILHLGFSLHSLTLQRQQPSCLAKHLISDQGKLIGLLQEYVKSGFEFKDGFEDGAAAEDVETETGAGEGDGEAADVAEVADCFCADEGEDDVCFVLDMAHFQYKMFGGIGYLQSFCSPWYLSTVATIFGRPNNGLFLHLCPSTSLINDL
jgi:hypothetical protein